MSITPGTLVELPNGRNGVVVPSPWWMQGQVLVKLPGGKRRWFKVDACTPVHFGASVRSDISAPSNTSGFRVQ